MKDQWIACLTLRGVSEMTPETANRVAKWLRDNAKGLRLAAKKKMYAGTFRARLMK